MAINYCEFSLINCTPRRAIACSRGTAINTGRSAKGQSRFVTVAYSRITQAVLCLDRIIASSPRAEKPRLLARRKRLMRSRNKSRIQTVIRSDIGHVGKSTRSLRQRKVNDKVQRQSSKFRHFCSQRVVNDDHILRESSARRVREALYRKKMNERRFQNFSKKVTLKLNEYIRPFSHGLIFDVDIKLRQQKGLKYRLIQLENIIIKQIRRKISYKQLLSNYLLTDLIICKII